MHRTNQLFENQYYSDIILAIYRLLNFQSSKLGTKQKNVKKMGKTKVSLRIILGILLPPIILVTPSVAANTTGLTGAFARV